MNKVDQTIEDAVDAYKEEVRITEEKDEYPSDEDVFDIFSEAEEAFKGVSAKLSDAPEQPYSASKNHYRIFSSNPNNGEKICFLDLQTSQKLEVGQRLYFGDELLKLDPFFDKAKINLDWIVENIRYCFDIEKFPNIRGIDDFIGAEVFVKEAEEL